MEQTMKYSSLPYNLKKELESEYDKRHADEKPLEPQFQLPEQHERKVINLAHKTDLYVGMTASDDATGTRHNANGYLRLVASNDHVEIELPVTALLDIIKQLNGLKLDLEAYDVTAEVHRGLTKTYYKDIKEYENQREADLIAALEDGKFTEKQMRYALDEIPF
jgi:hypothetical protein